MRIFTRVADIGGLLRVHVVVLVVVSHNSSIQVSSADGHRSDNSKWDTERGKHVVLNSGVYIVQT